MGKKKTVGTLSSRKFTDVLGPLLEIYKSHNEADKGLVDLLKQVTLTANDPTYIDVVLPYVKTLNKSKVKAVGDLVDQYFDGKSDKSGVKDGWRDLVPGTDEHYSTQAVYITLGTFKAAPKNKVNRTVLKNTMAVVSDFRLPTEETGHSAEVKKVKRMLGHPRGNKISVHKIEDKKATSHGTFDMLRRTLGIDAMKDHLENNKSDGTGAIIATLEEVSKFSSRIIGSTDAPDNKLNKKFKSKWKTAVRNRREDHKKKVNSLKPLSSRPKLKTQKIKSLQFNGNTPASNSLEVNSKGRMRARSPSPLRTLAD
jgi:hypothetical protein